MSGDSGNITEPHLHYEVIENDKHVDPEKYIKWCFWHWFLIPFGLKNVYICNKLSLYFVLVY